MVAKVPMAPEMTIVIDDGCISSGSFKEENDGFDP